MLMLSNFMFLKNHDVIFPEIVEADTNRFYFLKNGVSYVGELIETDEALPISEENKKDTITNFLRPNGQHNNCQLVCNNFIEGGAILVNG